MDPKEIEAILKEADFSRETGLKEKLFEKLFHSKGTESPVTKKTNTSNHRNGKILSLDSLEMVAAAGDLYANASRPEKDMKEE